MKTHDPNTLHRAPLNPHIGDYILTGKLREGHGTPDANIKVKRGESVPLQRPPERWRPIIGLLGGVNGLQARSL